MSTVPDDNSGAYEPVPESTPDARQLAEKIRQAAADSAGREPSKAAASRRRAAEESGDLPAAQTAKPVGRAAPKKSNTQG